MANESHAKAVEHRDLIRLRDRGFKAEKMLALMDKTLERQNRLNAHLVKWLYQAAFEARMALASCRDVNAAVAARLKELNDV